MEKITLNKTLVLNEGSTSKYWRDIKCEPQCVELKTWSVAHPFFILSGVIIDSHDKREIGMKKDVHVQTYSFFLSDEIERGVYTIND